MGRLKGYHVIAFGFKIYRPLKASILSRLRFRERAFRLPIVVDADVLQEMNAESVWFKSLYVWFDERVG
jgi:hypothetical protein